MNEQNYNNLNQVPVSTTPDLQQPLAPVVPVAVVEPVAQVAPVQQVVEPVQQAYVIPTLDGGFQQVQPVAAVEAVQVVQPVAAVEAVQVVQPVAAVEAVQVVQPVAVAEPVQVVQPVTVAEPVQVMQPVTAVAPVQQVVQQPIVQTPVQPEMTQPPVQPTNNKKKPPILILALVGIVAILTVVILIISGKKKDTQSQAETTSSTKKYSRSTTTTTTKPTTTKKVLPAKQYVKIITGSGKYVGDEIAIGNDHFYVVSNLGKKVKLMSKYNLYVGTNKTVMTNSHQYSGYCEATDTSSAYKYIRDNYKLFKECSNAQCPEVEYAYEANLKMCEGTRVSKNISIETSDAEYGIQSDLTLAAVAFDEKGTEYKAVADINEQYFNNYAKYLLKTYELEADVRAIEFADLLNLGCTETSCERAEKYVKNLNYKINSTKNYCNEYENDYQPIVEGKENECSAMHVVKTPLYMVDGELTDDALNSKDPGGNARKTGIRVVITIDSSLLNN